MTRRIDTDVLIIGGGLSGCMAAINAADHGARVAIMEKSHTERSGAAGTGNDHFWFWDPEIHSKRGWTIPDMIRDISFDVHAHAAPHIKIYGTQGTLLVPDPNTFGGPVKVKRAGAKEWSELPLTHTENSRGIAVADMAYALRTGRPHRATGEMAYHVLDIMRAVHEASTAGAHVDIESTCHRPEPLLTDLLLGRLDE